jgi:hypothetical protein
MDLRREISRHPINYSVSYRTDNAVPSLVPLDLSQSATSVNIQKLSCLVLAFLGTGGPYNNNNSPSKDLAAKDDTVFRSIIPVLPSTLTIRRAITSTTIHSLAISPSKHEGRRRKLTTPPIDPPGKDTKLCNLRTEPDRTHPLHPPRILHLNPL